MQESFSAEQISVAVCSDRADHLLTGVKGRVHAALTYSSMYSSNTFTLSTLFLKCKIILIYKLRVLPTGTGKNTNHLGHFCYSDFTCQAYHGFLSLLYQSFDNKDTLSIQVVQKLLFVTWNH